MHCNFLHISFAGAILLFFGLLGASANSDIFPAEPAAQKAVTWKDGYFWINGKPVFLASGEMHYARIPRELWEDRIWRAKAMGFNCIQTYVFWNASEAREGDWNFSDNLDLDAWLATIQKAGMYAIVRVGPYCCAEWDQGGFPAWLTVKPGMTLRDTGVDFDKYALRHLDQVEKIVAKHQLHQGGNVIMVQLENEHPYGWGTDDKYPYLGQLVTQARANGLEVPVFLSGLHHGNDPAGNSPFPAQASPWYSTEFWTGWIGKYGNMDPGMLAQKIAGTWKIIGFGGAGYDYYVVHGGTNFGYSGCSHDATYDYAAPISENGDFNNFYAPAKRAAYFAHSFSDLLTGSHDDPAFAKSDSPDIRVTTRTNPSLGSIVMLDRFGKKSDGGQIAPTATAYQTPEATAAGQMATRVMVNGITLPQQGAFSVATLEPSTLLVNVPWTENASFESICSNVLLRKGIGATDYWVLYGPPGGTGEITVKRKGKTESPISFFYPKEETIKQIDIDSGDQHKATFLVMNKDLTAQTWLVNDKLYIGPSFVEEDGRIEFPPKGGTATVYSADGKQSLNQPAMSVADVPALGEWQWSDAAPERSNDLKNGEWQSTAGPQPIGAVNSYQNRYAWYRTNLHADSATTTTLHFAGGPGPMCAAFLNGQPASLDSLKTVAGDNNLAILVKAEPRGTLYNQIGITATPIIRGIWGGVSSAASGTPLTVSWKTLKSGNPDKVEEVSKPTFNDSAWAPVDAAGIAGAAQNKHWLRGTFTLTENQLDSFISAPGFEKWKSHLYLNGNQIPSFSQDISKLLVSGTNVILLHPHDNKSAIQDVTLNLWPNTPLARATWYFHGGLSRLDETPLIGMVTNWNDFLKNQPWQRQTEATQLPSFWKTSFTYHTSPQMHETLGLLTDGLTTGHVWLNGHNLGEAPQKVPMYMPECWLKDGANDLVIFDLTGAAPDKVRITRYSASSVASVGK